MGVEGLNIFEFSIRAADLGRLRSIALGTLPEKAATDWLYLHSSLYGKGVPHAFQHVSRGVGLKTASGANAVEHFFSKQAFSKFTLTPK